MRRSVTKNRRRPRRRRTASGRCRQRDDPRSWWSLRAHRVQTVAPGASGGPSGAAVAWQISSNSAVSGGCCLPVVPSPRTGRTSAVIVTASPAGGLWPSGIRSRRWSRGAAGRSSLRGIVLTVRPRVCGCARGRRLGVLARLATVTWNVGAASTPPVGTPPGVASCLCDGHPHALWPCFGRQRAAAVARRHAATRRRSRCGVATISGSSQPSFCWKSTRDRLARRWIRVEDLPMRRRDAARVHHVRGREGSLAGDGDDRLLGASRRSRARSGSSPLPAERLWSSDRVRTSFAGGLHLVGRVAVAALRVCDSPSRGSVDLRLQVVGGRVAGRQVSKNWPCSWWPRSTTFETSRLSRFIACSFWLSGSP